MRALIISKAFVVASYRDKLVELARAGCDVIAVSPPSWREGGREQLLESGNSGEYALAVAPMRLNGRFHLHYYPTLPAIIDHVRPDIVHIDEEPYNLATFLAALACRRRGIPFVFFSWQNLIRRYPEPFRTTERAIYRWAAAGIAGTEAVAEVLRSKGFGGRLAVIPQFGVDPERFFPGAPPDSPIRFGFLNRLVEAKAPLLTLRAFALLPEDTKLLVVGDGPLRREVDAEIARLGLEERVSVQPRVPSLEVPEVIRSLHALLLPSLTTPGWKEQFGRVLIEAMASGVPVIGSDSGEIPRVVGDAGLIVPEGDAAALAGAMKRLYGEPALRRDLAVRGRDRALAYFTNGAVAEATLRLYRSLVPAEIGT